MRTIDADTTRMFSTPIVMAIVAAVVAAVAVGAWWVLSGSDDVSGQVLASDDGATEEQEAVATDDDIGVTEVLPEITYELLLTRDPFEAVRPEPDPIDPADPGDPSDPTDPSDPSDPGTPVDPTDPTSPTPVDPTVPVEPPIGPDDPCQPRDGATVCDGITVRVLEVGTDRARVQVGDVVYVPLVREVFASLFQLIEVGGDCALIRYDDRQTFRQCVDDPAFK